MTAVCYNIMGKYFFSPKNCSFCPYEYFCTLRNHCSWVILSSSIMVLKFSSRFTVVLHPRSPCRQKTGTGFNGSFAESARTAEIIRPQLLKVTVYRSLYVHMTLTFVSPFCRTSNQKISDGSTIFFCFCMCLC